MYLLIAGAKILNFFDMQKLFYCTFPQPTFKHYKSTKNHNPLPLKK